MHSDDSVQVCREASYRCAEPSSTLGLAHACIEKRRVSVRLLAINPLFNLVAPLSPSGTNLLWGMGVLEKASYTRSLSRYKHDA